MTKTIPLVGAPGAARALLHHCPRACVSPTHEGERRNALCQRHLPIVLAGPSVRKTSSAGVFIWLATSIAVEVSAWLARVDASSSADAPRCSQFASGTARSTMLGHHLHITLVGIEKTQSGRSCEGLPEGSILAYNMELHIPDSLSDWWFVGDAALLPVDVALGSYVLPTLIIPSMHGRQTRFIHGSCRKLHGRGDDAMTRALDALQSDISSPESRPSNLLLTGDQIYADDVDADVLGRIIPLSRRLFGRLERLPDGRFTEDVAVGARGAILRAGGFTVDEECSGNHLMGFGEFAGMYLFAWGPEVWRRFGTGLVNRSSNACKLLANISTYMIFDDHEITDDWNLTYEWKQRTRANPITRRVIANGLAAFWAFQWIGNKPGHDGGIPSAIANRERDGDAFDKTMWDFHDWSFVAELNPRVIFLDSRTQRRLEPERFPGNERPPGLLNDAAFQRLDSQLSALGGRAEDPAIIVAPAPVIGYEAIEGLQAATSNVDMVLHNLDLSGDPEAWSFHPTTFVRFLDTLAASGRHRFVILSGDVHYAFTVVATYTRSSGAQPVEIVQFTSTATKNEMSWKQASLSWVTRMQSDTKVHRRFGWRQDPPYQPVICPPGDYFSTHIGRPHDFEIRWRYLSVSGGDRTMIVPNNMGLVVLELNSNPFLTAVAQRLLAIDGNRYDTGVSWGTVAGLLQ
jgi:hypothetical protein